MHKLCIYKNPGEGWICQDLNHRSNGSTHSSLNGLVNDRFAGYAGFLRNKFDDNFSNDRMNMIKDYLKNIFKQYAIVYLDFPGDLKSGEILETEIHPLNAASNYLFKL